ncbi:MAG: hypothetical protein M1391_07720 [Bacteroidetes bacterium]|nr:hypothetical protein [Bacteroidota bacterium]
MIYGLSPLDIIVILIYTIVIIFLGLRVRNRIRNTGDYFMGGRRGSKIMMIANALGAGTHTDQAIAVAGATYQIGLAGIWYQWVWLFATPFYWLIAPIYRRVRYVTTGDFFEERYGSKIGVAYSVMGLLYFIINLGLILKGTSTAIEAVTSGQLSSQTIIILLTIFFLLYSVVGGLVSALLINLIQGVFIIIFSFLLIPFALNAAGGISNIKAQLPAYMFNFVAPHEVTLLFVITVVVNVLVGIVVEPHHMAVGGAGKSEINCRTGWTYGNFTKRLATLGWAFIGIFAAALFPGLTGENRELAFGLAASKLLPAGLIGLMISAMAAAVLGVSHNYMVAGSALFTRNFYKKIFKDLENYNELKVARISSIVIVVGAVTVALIIPNVVTGLKIIWQITAYFGIAFWMAVIWRGSNRYGVWASLAVTILTTLIVGPYFPFSFGLALEYQILFYLPAGFITFIVVSKLTKQEPEKQLDKFYSLLHTPVGEEFRLKEKGIDIIFEGESIHASKDMQSTLEKSGHSLLLVDLLSLHKKFSFKRYRIDLIGFFWAVLFVLAIFALGLIAASIG